MILGKAIPNDIPEHEVGLLNLSRTFYLLFCFYGKHFLCHYTIFQFFPKYGPDYSLEITPHHFRENKNSVRYVKGVLSVFKGMFLKV